MVSILNPRDHSSVFCTNTVQNWVLGIIIIISSSHCGGSGGGGDFSLGLKYDDIGGTRGAMVIVAGKGHGDTISNPGRD